VRTQLFPELLEVLEVRCVRKKEMQLRMVKGRRSKA
jgi:hypothetical protein